VSHGEFSNCDFGKGDFGKGHVGKGDYVGPSSPQGFQNDGQGSLWCAVAETEWGRIPGKAKDGVCWFSYGGKEHETRNFQLVYDRVLSQQPIGPSHGFQNDGAGPLWCAVANTPHGNIPGKANSANTCWYAYGGSEHETRDFSYVSHGDFGKGDFGKGDFGKGRRDFW